MRALHTAVVVVVVNDLVLAGILVPRFRGLALVVAATAALLLPLYLTTGRDADGSAPAASNEGAPGRQATLAEYR